MEKPEETTKSRTELLEAIKGMAGFLQHGIMTEMKPPTMLLILYNDLTKLARETKGFETSTIGCRSMLDNVDLFDPKKGP